MNAETQELPPITDRFVIKRGEWARSYPGLNHLLCDDGRRCCIGHYARHCGAHDDALLNVPDPCAVTGLPERAAWLVKKPGKSSGRGVDYGFNSESAANLVRINDSDRYTDDEREAEIARLFRLQGIEVVFED